jgi:hypothetical protein
MFRPGARYRWREGPEAVIEVADGGLLHLASGRLVACDPFWGLEVERQCPPFAVTVAPGRYPVTVSTRSMARALDSGIGVTSQTRIARARELRGMELGNLAGESLDGIIAAGSSRATGGARSGAESASAGRRRAWRPAAPAAARRRR